MIDFVVVDFFNASPVLRRGVRGLKTQTDRSFDFGCAENCLLLYNKP